MAVVYVVSEEGSFLVGDPSQGEAMVVTVEEAVAYATLAQDQMERDGNPERARHDVCCAQAVEDLIWSTAPDGYTRAGQKERLANKPRNHLYYTVLTFTPSSKSVRGRARLAAQQVDKIDRRLRKKDLSVALITFPGDARSNQIMREAKVKADEGKHSLIVAAPPSSPEVKAILELYSKDSVKHRRIGALGHESAQHRARNDHGDPLAGLDRVQEALIADLYERWVFSEEQDDPNEALYDVWEYEDDFDAANELVRRGLAEVVESGTRGPESYMVIRITGHGAVSVERAMAPGPRTGSSQRSRKSRVRSLNARDFDYQQAGLVFLELGARQRELLSELYDLLLSNEGWEYPNIKGISVEEGSQDDQLLAEMSRMRLISDVESGGSPRGPMTITYYPGEGVRYAAEYGLRLRKLPSRYDNPSGD
jgi:hypothetical protein